MILQFSRLTSFICYKTSALCDSHSTHSPGYNSQRYQHQSSDGSKEHYGSRQVKSTKQISSKHHVGESKQRPICSNESHPRSSLRQVPVGSHTLQSVLHIPSQSKLSPLATPAPKYLGGTSSMIKSKETPIEQSSYKDSLNGLIQRAIIDKDEKEREDSFLVSSGTDQSFLFPCTTPNPLYQHTRWNLLRFSWFKSLIGVEKKDTLGFRDLATFYQPMNTDDDTVNHLTPSTIDWTIDSKRQLRAKKMIVNTMLGKTEDKGDYDIINMGSELATSTILQESALNNITPTITENADISSRIAAAHSMTEYTHTGSIYNDETEHINKLQHYMYAYPQYICIALIGGLLLTAYSYIPLNFFNNKKLPPTIILQ